MHGLVFRTLQVFVQDTYGPETWADVVLRAELDAPVFESMFHYDPALLDTVLAAVGVQLDKPRDAILEDVGTYLVSHPNCEGLRRLLRFGGVDFIEFLHSLDDLPDRARLAVSDLVLPEIELQDHAQNRFHLRITGQPPGFGHVMVGVLRAMADDYGALVLMDHLGQAGDSETIDLTVIETSFARGRDFELAAAQPAAGGDA